MANEILNKSQGLLRDLRRQIDSGLLPAGQRLPPERVLSERYGVSRVTVRSALGVLAEDGMIERTQGRGTFVAHRPLHAPGQAPALENLGVVLNPRTAQSYRDWPLEQLSNEFLVQVLAGFGRAMTACGGRMQIVQPAPDQPFVRFGREVVARHEAAGRDAPWDGLVFVDFHLTDEDVAWLRQQKIPFVVFGPPTGALRHSYVDVDNVQGTYRTVKHLLSMGRQRVGLIDVFTGAWHGQDRLKGYRRALRESGLPLMPDLEIDPCHFEHGQEGVLAWLLEHTQRYDALVIHDSALGPMLARQLPTRGVRVPEDVAIVFYDDFPRANEHVSPAPTCLHQPFEEMAEDAVNMVQAARADAELGMQVKIYQPWLVIRESCGMRALAKT